MLGDDCPDHGIGVGQRMTGADPEFRGAGLRTAVGHGSNIIGFRP